MPAISPLKRLRSLGLLTVATILLAGCAELPKDAPITQVDYRGCLITEVDPAQSGVAELADYALGQAVVTYGIKSTTITSSSGNFAKNLKTLAKLGCSLVEVFGSDFDAGLKEATAQYPKLNFVYLTTSQTSESASLAASNLSVVVINRFEAGLALGYLAASLSENHWVQLTSPEPTETDFTLGVQVGVSRYGNDKNLPTQFTKVANGLETANLYPDVFINPIDNLNLDLSNYPNSRYLVLGFGSDLYLKPSLADSKSHLATTLVPAVGDNLMSIISSDLEGDFVGGIPGVIKLTFGNQGFDFTAEHDVNISQAKLDEVARVASDYETRIQ